ncbi:MAG: hypothetical protein QOF39_1353 [Frankiales bacterium]|nr:hypothetical protein [Frankiales bacterium]
MRTGRLEVVVELCQYVLLLRLVAAILVVFNGSLPHYAVTRWAVVASCIIAVLATLTWRRAIATVAAHPLVVVVDIAVSLWALNSAPTSAAILVIALTTALLIGLVYDRVAAALLGACLTGGYLVNQVPVHPGDGVSQGGRLVSQLAAMALLTVAGRVVAERIDRLSAQTESSMLLLAQAEERARLAREMHDSVVKTLHGLALSTLALADAPPPQPALRDRLLMVAEAAETGASEARSLLTDLRADEPDRPLAETLRGIVEDWSARYGVSASYDAQGVADLDGSGRWELVMATREALDNVAQHANASHVAVTLLGDRSSVSVVVADDGAGMDPDRERAAAIRRGHYGLQSMYERMDRVGGLASISGAADQGVTVRLTVPQPARGGRG